MGLIENRTTELNRKFRKRYKISQCDKACISIIWRKVDYSINDIQTIWKGPNDLDKNIKFDPYIITSVEINSRRTGNVNRKQRNPGRK